MLHTADVHCGNCGSTLRIALGHASAIACPSCKTEIQLGEEELPKPAQSGIGKTVSECFRCGEKYNEQQFVDCAHDIDLTALYSMAAATIADNLSMEMRRCCQCGAPISRVVKWGK